MKAQSVLYNYKILLNRENERPNIQFTFLKLNPTPLHSLFGQVSPYGHSPFKLKKLQLPLKKCF